MNPNIASKIHPSTRALRVACCALLFCLACTAGRAASSFTGVYFGTYTGLSEQGNVALFVGSDGWGAMISYANNGEGGSVAEGFTVNSSGSFNFTVSGGTQVMGTINGSAVTGTYFGLGGTGSFNASLKASTGNHQASAGYYSGSANNGGTAFGALKLILAADGSFRGTEQDLPDDGEVDDGYQGTINSQNQFSFSSLSQTSVSGSLNPTTATLSGTWQTQSDSGPIALTRTRALNPAPCSYAITPGDAKLSAQGGDGSFTVTAADGCAWTATTYQSWLHTTSSGSGNGTVTFYADPNTAVTLRQGVITVGGQSFGVVQGPAGYVWHNVFGWLYEAGSGWHHADGFGWMWFHGGGQWIWSSNLKGWVAITDANSRALWSMQFRWLTPVINDPYKADSTAIGQVYLGKYLANAIPDGWVVSERFGYVWANGDGQWFWSDGMKTWLGVTPDGGIWSVKEGKFL